VAEVRKIEKKNQEFLVDRDRSRPKWERQEKLGSPLLLGWKKRGKLEVLAPFFFSGKSESTRNEADRIEFELFLNRFYLLI
jgi:hypothetical protein